MQAVAVVWSGALVVALGTSLPAVAETRIDGSEIVPADAVPVRPDTDSGSLRRGDGAVIADQPAEATESPAAPAFSVAQMAQFQLPQQAGPNGAPPTPATPFLKYQYAIGSESDVTYRRDADLDRRLRDNSLILAPQINGYVLYRPTDRLEMLLEMLVEREIAAKEEKIVTLPNGETQVAPRRYTSLPVDQAWVTFKQLGPLDLTVGRRNFEDDRHWLYDTSLDTGLVKLKQGAFQAEASVSRKDRLDLDLLAPVQKTRIDNYMLYLDYRGIEDIRLAGYSIYREDQTGKEGKPLNMGLRAYGMPSDQFNFWTELGLLRGKDEFKQNLKAHAIDVGGTYRFTGLPLYPSVTLGYAYGSGDGNPNDSKNHEFRQTGLQSNEGKFGGVTKFKYYGEVLDPELSNLEILTAGLGFRPTPNVFVDLVYHKYRLKKIADEIRNGALTAQMNQDDTQLSKDVGEAFDIVLGFRHLFGVKRLGLDLRAGWFFPGKAFRIENTIDPDNPTFRGANKGISVLAKFWY
ncbi:alginate export family protein [Crenobacter cavernae]|nr:alginate export family protein [Crenobacter cavernae]